MIPIKGHATFHPLKHCIVGKVHHPDQVADGLKKVMQETGEDLDDLVNVLQKFGVECYRPVAERLDQRPPISPRDYFVALGETLIVGKVVAGYKEILKQIDRKNISWYHNDDISSANMIRCGDHIHWDISKYVSVGTENKIMSWLQDMGYKVHVTRYGWHMDGVYSILKPGVMVATRYLPELESIYRGWNIFYPRANKTQNPIRHEWGGDHTETNFDVNLLSVDEEHCILPTNHTALLKFLEDNKINPIVCKLRHKEFWDNGLHCMTQDLYREGNLENYF
jgi:hypothetical protein